MKTNHQRSFRANTESANHRHVSSYFKRISRRAFRSTERGTLQRGMDPDSVVLPTHRRHGEDIWYYD